MKEGEAIEPDQKQKDEPKWKPAKRKPNESEKKRMLAAVIGTCVRIN